MVLGQEREIGLSVLALQELQAYVKKFYTTGLTWNPKGVEAVAKKVRADLLAVLSKGSDVTKGLKKNPALKG